VNVDKQLEWPEEFKEVARKEEFWNDVDELLNIKSTD
jgi:hypothetical protein